ncbi:hypothetical protein CFC21_031917 [Triticum aestivum]|uniref:Reticulon domain-containing protein n=3 Tax=Triticinae TaxID=1648030 RepID=A0A453D288_AEGTS|nr:putative HVA22-like protein g [Aegilops tauschii subsp. strangulata]XP_044334481.1 putative HVA22-like protein g [Triticum aestivum]KAF7018650.1 hypothetical protein CFC21_031917 [Triticum aestivum]
MAATHHRPLHALLGGGAVADLLLWRRRNTSAAAVAGATLFWFLFERAVYSLASVLSNAVLLLVDILFFWAKSASLLNRVLVAMPTVVERFVDWTVSWLPMYEEAKLLLVIYLWHPSTRGAGHVYDGFLHPLVAWHEADIDRGLLELRARAKDVTASQLKAAAVIGQVWLGEAARCVSSQLQAARSGREGATH